MSTHCHNDVIYALGDKGLLEIYALDHINNQTNNLRINVASLFPIGAKYHNVKGNGFSVFVEVFVDGEEFEA